MTDEEIIKALECCKNGNPCSSCPYSGKCTDEDFNDNYLMKDVIDLINRQQAEIERLETELKAMRGAANTYKKHYETAKSEAIKEFAERLKDEMRFEDNCRYDCMNCYYECKEYVPIIDNVAEEMTEGGVKNEI